MNKLFTLFCVLGTLIFLSIGKSFAQYTVTDDRTSEQLVDMLTGEGVEITSSSLDCNPGANGTFEGTGDLGIDTGIVPDFRKCGTVCRPFYFLG
ncbi:MAG: hypothetical protein KL787_10400 [Taibaiella sp.]|nr:hypothetical protein [Taibaiella sp.]